MPQPGTPNTVWRPTRLVRVVKSFDSSTGATEVKTDATFGFLKAMGNRQGPHALASELVGSTLAKWFGLTVPDFAVLHLPEDSMFDLPRENRTEVGPAFVSRHMAGGTWQGSDAELRSLENHDDITVLIVFDTWIRNCDRHPPDLRVRDPNYKNVYLADTENPKKSRLVAIDHTHCFDGGRDLTERLGDIDKIKDESTYGLFPAFIPYLSVAQLLWCKAQLREVTQELAETVVRAIPAEWQVEPAAISALARQIHTRAGFVADRIETGWPIPTVAGDE